MIRVLGHNQYGKENEQCANHDSLRCKSSVCSRKWKVAEVCREYDFSDATYYNWKAKYGGMEVPDIK